MPRRMWTCQASHLTVVTLSLFLGGCGSDNGIVSPERSSLTTLTLEGLEPLEGGLNYQAWLVSRNRTSVFGFPLVLFNIDELGQMVDPVSGAVLTGPFHSTLDPDAVEGVAISLEQSQELLTFSSFTFILSGGISEGTAEMVTGDWLELNRDFSNISGSFVLATPTDQDPGNELNGVWFMDPTEVPTKAGLSLPEAPPGWIYESWISQSGKNLSMGKFVGPNQPDSTAVFSGGSGDSQAFPGEDFLLNEPPGFSFPLALSGASVFVTLEPWEPMDSHPEDPFFLRLLEGQIPAEPTALTLNQMTSLFDQLPTGTAVVEPGS